MSELLKIDTPDAFEYAVERATGVLRSGGIVALPTETVYGLAACATDPKAVQRIFLVKGRPANNPIIVHVSDTEMARQYVSQWPASAQKLSEAFWPGPLTMVLKKNDRIPSVVTAGGGTVAIRAPNHPFTLAVIKRCGVPLAAPSANLSGRLSPTTAQHVIEQLGDKIDLIVDGGPTQVGIESTVIDLTGDVPKILRPGVIHAGIIEQILGKVTTNQEVRMEGQPLPSPGLLPRHYAPRTPLYLIEFRFSTSPSNQEDRYASVAKQFGVELSECYVLAYKHVPAREAVKGLSVMPGDPVGYARVLYAELHRADASGARLILVEKPPLEVQWQGVLDRLQRAQCTKVVECGSDTLPAQGGVIGSLNSLSQENG